MNPLLRPPPLPDPANHWALFFDVDGTLVEDEINDARDNARNDGPGSGEARRRIADLQDLKLDLRHELFAAEREAAAAAREADRVDAMARAAFIRRFGFPPA